MEPTKESFETYLNEWITNKDSNGRIQKKLFTACSSKEFDD